MVDDEGGLETLLSEMTLEEKVGQLSLYSAEVSVDGASGVNPVLNFKAPTARFEDIRAGRVTGFFNGHGDDYIRELQTMAVKESRLGVPLLFAADVIHGFRTCFPVPLAEAASFEPDLARRTARAAALEASAVGLHWTFSPGADICRDARWGRVVESSGEDALLASRLAAARVEGYQGEDLSSADTMLATVKHFAAYGAAEAGLDYNTAEITRSTLVEHHLPAFKAAVRAGVGAVMTAFNDIDGVPASANRELLTHTLRDQWGFPGIVVSDFSSDLEVMTHGLASSPREAAKLCFLAGLDMSMHSGIYAEHLPDLVRDGEIDEAAIDQAVMRVLKTKARLGLFQDPYRGLNRPPAAPNRALARAVGPRCMVLLKNVEGALPLKPSAKVALIGPFAREHQHLNGAWAVFSSNAKSVNLYDGLAEALGEDKVATAPGSGIIEALDGGCDEASTIARDADVVIVALGEDQKMSGESRSRADISLPEPQMALLRTLKSLGKPLVLLLRCGRPMAIAEAAELSDALLVTWYLGSEMGSAVADVLTGKAPPSGRLPMTFPRHAGQVPIYYARKSTGRPPFDAVTPFRARYIDVAPGPLYPFGFGLGYGAASYGPVSVDQSKMPWDGEVTVSCDVREVAGVALDEVVQLYVHDVAASRVRPVRELKDFRKIHLASGAATRVEFTLKRADLAFLRADNVFDAEPGLFAVWISPHAEAGEPASFTLEAPGKAAVEQSSL